MSLKFNLLVLGIILLNSCKNDYVFYYRENKIDYHNKNFYIESDELKISGEIKLLYDSLQVHIAILNKSQYKLYLSPDYILVNGISEEDNKIKVSKIYGKQPWNPEIVNNIISINTKEVVKYTYNIIREYKELDIYLPIINENTYNKYCLTTGSIIKSDLISISANKYGIVHIPLLQNNNENIIDFELTIPSSVVESELKIKRDVKGNK
ncbi:MAG: hypothetical protein KFKLKKLM_01609 [Flavobacteriales bacterium]|nr:hypothetical protein [Flavobacteriales bacterium]